MSLRTQLLASAALILVAQSANAVVITFDSVPGSGTIHTTPQEFDGYVFCSDHYHLFDDRSGGAASGSTWMGEEGGGRGGAITMSQADGGAFSLLSIDVSEFDPYTTDDSDFPNARFFDILGIKFDGSSVLARFQLDGIIDGRFGLLDFESFTLGGLFTDLISVNFSGVSADGRAGGVAFDNLHVVPTGVPEPGTLGLMGLGLIAVGLVRRKKIVRR